VYNAFEAGEMSRASLEQRVRTLEQELARLKVQMNGDKRPWWEKVWGTFANDPAFEKAMQYGREYRESLRPKPLKKRKSKSSIGNGRSRH
jgi:hypothetical protein